jgi:hypothetical protein
VFASESIGLVPWLLTSFRTELLDSRTIVGHESLTGLRENSQCFQATI